MRSAAILPISIDPVDRQSYPASPESGLLSLTLKFLPVRKGMETTAGRQALKLQLRSLHIELSVWKSNPWAVLRYPVGWQQVQPR